jgi:hypothetical protein
MKFESWGQLLLSIFLILFGLLTFPPFKMEIAYEQHVLAIIAVAAGVLLWLKR